MRLIPHSRCNGLSRTELEQAGYVILTSSPGCGVDSFAKSFGSQFVFLQGHPEYDANSLAREYRREVDRYLRRETERKPVRPIGYFGAEAEAGLRSMERSGVEGSLRMPIKDTSIIDALAPVEAKWREAAVGLYRSWLEMIANRNPGTRAPLHARTDEFASLPSI